MIHGGRARKRRGIENAYLLEIREDFELNESSLKENAARLEEIIRSMLVLHEQSVLESPSLSVAELNEKLKVIGSMPSFIPVNRAYANPTGSGDLGTRTFRNMLAQKLVISTDLLDQLRGMLERNDNILRLLGSFGVQR